MYFAQKLLYKIKITPSLLILCWSKKKPPCCVVDQSQWSRRRDVGYETLPVVLRADGAAPQSPLANLMTAESSGCRLCLDANAA